LFVLKNLKFLMPLDNSLFENNGRNATIQMWAFWIMHMTIYLRLIFCSMIGVQGNTQKQWGNYELEALCTKNLRSV
jgi:hypothetical protein